MASDVAMDRSSNHPVVNLMAVAAFATPMGFGGTALDSSLDSGRLMPLSNFSDFDWMGRGISQGDIGTASLLLNRNLLSDYFLSQELSDRPTSAIEERIGQLRGWSLLSSNWDGEGSPQPNAKSIETAVRFIRLIGSTALNLPEPMLFSSGRAGLYWDDAGVYADLEFLDDEKVSYYIETSDQGKHKGVASFNSEQIPAVFKALLPV